MPQTLLDQIAEQADDKRVAAVARLAGRPTKLHPALAARVIQYVLEGAYAQTACQAVGITKRTFLNWRDRADEWTGAEVDWEDVPEKEKIYVHLFQAVRLAEAQAELKLLRKAVRGERSWQAAMTVLERKYPNRWGKQEKRIHSGDPDRPPVVMVESEGERRARVAAILQNQGALDV